MVSRNRLVPVLKELRMLCVCVCVYTDPERRKNIRR